MKRIILSFLALGLLVPLATFSQEKPTIDASKIFGDLQARQIGPALMSGRINDLELHPTNPRIMYAGAAGGDVKKVYDCCSADRKPKISLPALPAFDGTFVHSPET